MSINFNRYYRSLVNLVRTEPEIRRIRIKGLYKRFLSRPISQCVWKSYIRLFTDKAPLNRISFNIVYGCNLGCDYCNHLSQLDRGYVPLNELIRWYEIWNKKVAPYRISLLGGEPLLHPQIEEVILSTVKHWNNAKIDILSNGLLIPQKADTVLKLLKEVDATVLLTKHFDDPVYNAKFNTAIALLKQYKIDFNVQISYLGWIKFQQYVDGRILPFNSNYKKAWNNCGSKNACLTIDANKLYKCAALSAYCRLAQLGKLPPEWNRVLSYKPLTEHSTKDEILKHVSSGAMPQCSVCPEKYEYVPTNEVTSTFHKLCAMRQAKTTLWENTLDTIEQHNRIRSNNPDITGG